MENRPIPVSDANIMIQEFINYMTKLGVDPSQQTQSVSFTGKELMAWLNQTMPNADELKICLGVYPTGDPNAGRITVILWPYKDGQPVPLSVSEGKDGPPPPPPPAPPYNQGSLQP